MFDRFIRLARAKNALRAGRLEEAARLARDPAIAEERAAAEIVQAAIERLLQRARQRWQAGEARAAQADLTEILAQRDHPEARALRDEWQAAEQQQQGQKMRAGAALHEAARAVERGQLRAAEVQLADLAAVDERGSARLQGQMAQRRARAGEHLVAAARAAAHDDGLRTALAEFRAALALDRDQAEAHELRTRLPAAWAKVLLLEFEPLRKGGLPADALRLWRDAELALPGFAADAAAHGPAEAIATWLIAAVQQDVQGDDVARLARSVLELQPALPGKPAHLLQQACGQIVLLADLAAVGAFRELAAALDQIHGWLGGRPLAAASAAARAQADETERALAHAHELAGKGDAGAARVALTALLSKWPMHRGARQALDLLDEGQKDQQERLRQAQQAARDGRLTEACRIALTLTGTDATAEAARLLLQELRARMDLVQKGVDQLRAAAHGRDSAGREGLTHCLSRAEELRKIHSDHPDLAGIADALRAEIAGLEALHAAFDALEQDRDHEVGIAVQRVLERRTEWLSPARLDARLQTLGDRLLARTEQAVLGGRLEAAEQLLATAQLLVPVGCVAGNRTELLGAQLGERRDAARLLVAQARERLQQRDLADAEQMLEQALGKWGAIPEARQLGSELRGLRQQTDTLDRVARLAEQGDLDGAGRHLQELPPTPPLLRTRIFDLKQNLAKAQGLDGAFLLRVDEGGEFLVLRGEAITVGNVREGRADLPILANIASRHAAIQRSMSFHGGMADTVVAVDGEVRVGRDKVKDHRLKSGDRFTLGTALQVEYLLPSRRSLSAALRLMGGFQVAGTDRVLLLKDRGRDGRLLLGPAADSHVRLGNATAEVELFANRNGQICVRCEVGGTIAGKPFTGEHPVEAGALVEAGGVQFVLLPHGRRA